MGVIRRSQKSIKDYQAIWDYIAAQGNPGAADRLLAEFEVALSMLSDHPNAGPSRPELQNRLRSFPVGSYVIFYKPIRNGVELTRVIHGNRNLRAIFKR